jgi:hypothetical protein
MDIARGVAALSVFLLVGCETTQCIPNQVGTEMGCHCDTISGLPGSNNLGKCSPGSEALRLNVRESDVICCLKSGGAPNNCNCFTKASKGSATCFSTEAQVTDCYEATTNDRLAGN